MWSGHENFSSLMHLLVYLMYLTMCSECNLTPSPLECIQKRFILVCTSLFYDLMRSFLQYQNITTRTIQRNVGYAFVLIGYETKCTYMYFEEWLNPSTSDSGLCNFLSNFKRFLPAVAWVEFMTAPFMSFRL